MDLPPRDQTIAASSAFKTSVPEGKAGGARGEAEGEPCFVTFVKAENYLGLDKSHLLSHTLALGQGEKNEGPDRRSKYFALYSAGLLVI